MHLNLCLDLKILFLSTVAFQLVLPISAGTRSLPKTKTSLGKSVTKKFTRIPITNIERPPVLSASEKKSGMYDDAGVTLPPMKSKPRPKVPVPLNKLDLLGSLRRFKSAFSRISNAVTNKNSSWVSEARYMDGWMEGAMVPMTFLLMAAFIMDILQRLFPLPYATFVSQAYGKNPVATVGTTTQPTDLTKVQVNTPLGNFGIETNENDGFNLFGRSQQGNPQIVPSSVPYGNSNTTSNDDPRMNYYLNSILSADQTPPVISEGVSYGIPIVDNMGWGYNGYLPGPGPIPGPTDFGNNNQNPGSNNNGMDTTTTDNNKQGGYGYNDDSKTTSGGYGSSDATGTNDPLAGASELESFVEIPSGSEPLQQDIPSTYFTSSINDMNEIPLDNLDLLEYYAQLEDVSKSLWNRRKRSTTDKSLLE
ncbi:unnamed protein product [Allacma fusca]|uniref:Uncharacterized protein n=1 Tax=Allacma fusca TaxID=39272 RepID=A0A8J2JMV0_9HEXA|nr:unnamed protein product [Allacma fusca]